MLLGPKQSSIASKAAGKQAGVNYHQKASTLCDPCRPNVHVTMTAQQQQSSQDDSQVTDNSNHAVLCMLCLSLFISTTQSSVLFATHALTGKQSCTRLCSRPHTITSKSRLTACHITVTINATYQSRYRRRGSNLPSCAEIKPLSYWTVGFASQQLVLAGPQATHHVHNS
jgi:hypothetical protein